MRGLITVSKYLANIRLGLGFLFFCATPKFNNIKVIFNRLLRFAITWRLHYSKTGEARQVFVLKRIKSHFWSSVKYLKCNTAVSTVSVRNANSLTVMKSSCEIFCLPCTLASRILLFVFSFYAFQGRFVEWFLASQKAPLRALLTRGTNEVSECNAKKDYNKKNCPHTGHQFGEFVVMSLKTYGNSLISIYSIL